MRFFQGFCIILHSEFTTRVITIFSLSKCYTILINVFDIRKIKYSEFNLMNILNCKKLKHLGLCAMFVIHFIDHNIAFNKVQVIITEPHIVTSVLFMGFKN